MAKVRLRAHNIGLLLILTVSWYSKCAAIEYFDSDLEKFNRIVQDGLLKHISKGIATEDNGNTLNCAEDLQKWSEGLESFEMWALKMLDASGRPPHGILHGNINSLGMFEECVGINHQRDDSSRPIKGKYCLARFPIPVSIRGSKDDNIISSSLEAIMTNFGEINQRTQNAGPKGTYFNLAVCMPASCKASDVELVLKGALANYDINLSVELPGEYCSVDEPRTWNAGDICGLVILAVVGVLLIWGTIYDLWFQANKNGDCESPNTLLMAFSVYTNSLRLTTLSKDPGPLASIHGIRVISLGWIILGHRYVEGVSFPSENFLDLVEWMQTYPAMLITVSTISVDTFLLLSGILISYIFFRRTDNKSLKDIPLMYLHRFLRLTPVLVMVILLQFTFFDKIGRGPFWKQLNARSDFCREYWWSTLLYVQNYVNRDDKCIAQTWYLSVDMQLYILSPLLLFPVLKHAKIGVIWICAWILAALVTVFTVCYVNEWVAANNSDPTARERTYYYYYATHMRAAPWLIGLLGGYYLRVYNLKDIKINKILVCVLWIASLSVMAAVLFGTKPLSDQTHKFSYIEDTTYLAFSKPAWSIAVLWVIVACAFGYGGPVNWFLSLRLWEFLARLTYSMYLIHVTLINFFNSSLKTVPYFSHTTMAHLYIGDLLLTIVVSYFMVLAFESPVTVLEKLIFGSGKKKPITHGNVVLEPEQMKRSLEDPEGLATKTE